MKRYLSSIMLAALAAGAFTACSGDDDDYQWATATGQQVFFPNTIGTKIEIPMSGSTFTLPIQRVETASAITVGISQTDTTGFFTIPSEVSFAAGEATAEITVTYDNTMMVYDEFVKDTISIATDYTTPYGYATLAFSAGASSPYESLGKGTYEDHYYFNGVKSYSVEISQNQEMTNTFRISNPYRGTYVSNTAGDDYIELVVLKAGDVYRDVTLENDGLVGFNDFYTGYVHEDYDAEICLLFPGRFTSLGTESSWLHNRVLAWQEDGVTPGQIQLAPYFYMFNVGGWNATQGDGNVIITFPGYDPKDFSLSMTYAGIFTNIAEEPYAVVSLEKGEDVEDVRAVVVSADEDAEEVANAIAEGTIEGTPISGTQGNVPIPQSMTGKMQVVVAVISEEELVAYDAAVFEYWGGGVNPWQSIGTGTFTDNFVVTMYGPDQETTFEPMSYEVEVLENNEQPGLYRVVNAYEKVAEFLECDYTSASLEINASDPEGVYFTMQETGIDDGDGMVYVASYGGYAIDNGLDVLKEHGYVGTLADGVITLPILETSSGSKFQGIFAQGSNAWYAGESGEFRLVLPAANAQARMLAPQHLNAKADSWVKHITERAARVRLMPAPKAEQLR